MKVNGLALRVGIPHRRVGITFVPAVHDALVSPRRTRIRNEARIRVRRRRAGYMPRIWPAVISVAAWVSRTHPCLCGIDRTAFQAPLTFSPALPLALREPHIGAVGGTVSLASLPKG